MYLTKIFSLNCFSEMKYERVGNTDENYLLNTDRKKSKNIFRNIKPRASSGAVKRSFPKSTLYIGLFLSLLGLVF